MMTSVNILSGGNAFALLYGSIYRVHGSFGFRRSGDVKG